MEVAMAKTGYSRDVVAGRRSNTLAKTMAVDHVASPCTARLSRLSRMASAISGPDFVAIAIFCAIGLLATVNVMLRLPDIGLL
jgi:hypothetical protein